MRHPGLAAQRILQYPVLAWPLLQHVQASASFLHISRSQRHAKQRSLMKEPADTHSYTSCSRVAGFTLPNHHDLKAPCAQRKLLYHAADLAA